MNVKDYCSKLREWAKLMRDSDPKDESGFAGAWMDVERAITKSCLLSRTMYGGEKPSQTPCPVHKGQWVGIHCGWPGSKWSDGTPIDIEPRLQEWRDQGCRCNMHRGCGCTTGWQPDEHCGCGVKA